MIDKKTSYKDQKLTKAQQKKIKPANQGGGPNYLGKQETVTVPKKWLSSPDHVVAELAYITPREQKILLEADLYGSLKGKPNRGPGGIMSLQGDMGSFGGPSGDNNGGNGGGENRPDRTNPNNPPRSYSPPTTNTPDNRGDNNPKPKTTTPPFNIHYDDPNAPPAYEIIGGKKFDVTPKTRDERNQAKVKQSILDAPIPNFTPKGIEYFKDGKLLTNSLVPGDDPLGKPKFNLLNTVGNVLGYAYGGPLFAKYKQAQALYKGAKLATDVLSDITGKNVSKPFQTVENLTKNIGLKDKNVIESFKDSLTNNLTSKTRTKNKPESVINIDTKNNNEGINTLENVNALQDEYKTLLQKLQTGIITDEEQVRYNMLKNMLGI